MHPLHVDAASLKKSGAAFELIERRRERRHHFGVSRQRAHSGSSLVGIALNGEETLDQSTDLAWKPGAGTERGLFEKAIGDFSDRAPAERVNAGDRQQVGHKRMRTLWIGAGERR